MNTNTSLFSVKKQSKISSISALLLIIVLGLTGVSLSGCSSDNALPEPKVQSEDNYPALDTEQIQHTLQSVDEALKNADKDKKTETAQSRVADPALAMREAQYRLFNADNKYAVPEIPTGSEISTVSNSKNWPRVLLNVTKPNSQKHRYVQIIKQADPKTGFKLYQWMQLLPDFSFPATDSSVKGSATLPSKEKGKLTVSPLDTVKKWAELASNSGDKAKNLFAEDSFTKSQHDRNQKITEAVKEVAEYSTKYSVSTPEKDIVALSLPDGGALVTATYIRNCQINKVKKDRPITLGGPIGALLGNSGKITTQANWDETLTIMFQIPSATAKDKKIKLIAAEDVITNVKNG